MLLHNRPWVILHFKNLVCLKNLHSAYVDGILLCTLSDFCFITDKQNINAKLFYSKAAAFKYLKRRIISAESINNNFHFHSLFSVGFKIFQTSFCKSRISLALIPYFGFKRRQYAEICTHRLKILRFGRADVFSKGTHHSCVFKY